MNNLLNKITEFTKKIGYKNLALKVSPDIQDSEIEYIIEFMKRFNISGVIISNATDKNRGNLEENLRVKPEGCLVNH